MVFHNSQLSVTFSLWSHYAAALCKYHALLKTGITTLPVGIRHQIFGRPNLASQVLTYPQSIRKSGRSLIRSRSA